MLPFVRRKTYLALAKEHDKLHCSYDKTIWQRDQLKAELEAIRERINKLVPDIKVNVSTTA